MVEKDSESLAQRAADTLFSRITTSPHFYLGLAAGRTPSQTYRILGERFHSAKKAPKNLFCFHLDEYVGMTQNDSRSFAHFLKTNVVVPWQLEENQVRFWRGDAVVREKECQAYEVAIQKRGGIDCQILGLGMNGHIGFNEPGSSKTSRCREVALTGETLQHNKEHLAGGFLPTHALTMGIANILEAKKILLLVSGRKKRKSLQRFLREDPHSDFPATFLKGHLGLTVICDREAAGDL